MKHLGMVEEFERWHITMLSWAMMGSGALSLSFLEKQIYGRIPPQLRYHGYMNDKEFAEACAKRGILPYGVVYQAQSWEIPVRLNDEETDILEINILRSAQTEQNYGLRAFSKDTYPKLFEKSFQDYFPEGLKNSLSETVTDLYEECVARRLDGSFAHSHWVEVEGLWQTCHATCRNNPVWRAYIKKTAEILIDAGAKAVQLDECEAPICSIGDGGCFCKDCLAQFRDYLIELKTQGKLPAELAAVDLFAFDYGAYLRGKGYTGWPDDFVSAPLAETYWAFQVTAHNKHFREVIRHTREYAARKKQTIKISGNFTNMHLLYLPCLHELDVCVTELRRTVFRRHNWYRLAVGFTGEKPLVIAESPYDEFMPAFLRLIKAGKGGDYYRLFMMEAAAHGGSMCLPYGAWMGRENFDSFYPPEGVATEVQDFLYYNENLFGKKSGANVLVLCTAKDNMLTDWQRGYGESLEIMDAEDLFSYKVVYNAKAMESPFNEVSLALTDARIPYDVKILGDGGLWPDTFAAADLAGYEKIVAPGCAFLTDNQAKILAECGKPLYVFGKFGGIEPGQLKTDDLNVLRQAIEANGVHKQPYAWDSAEIYVQQALTEAGRVLHVLNYALDKTSGKTIPHDVILTVPGASGVKDIKTLDGQPVRWEAQLSGSVPRMKLNGVPAYCAVILE
jgi:hypothetical protein